MKTTLIKSLCMSIAAFGFALAGQVGAQTLSTLYSFTSLPTRGARTNSDGANPFGGLAISGDTLYGTTQAGGTGPGGTLFQIKTDGTGLKVLHNFQAYPSGDGTDPMGGLLLSDNTLYGTTESGGIDLAHAHGTVFAINTDGSSFAILYSFPFIPKKNGLPSGGLAQL